MDASARSNQYSYRDTERTRAKRTPASVRLRISSRKLPEPQAGSRNFASTARVLLPAGNMSGMRSSIALTSRSWVNTSARSRTRWRVLIWPLGSGDDGSGVLHGTTPPGKIGTASSRGRVGYVGRILVEVVI